MTARRSSPPASMPFGPGTVLAGKYRVERLLGEGGMGWVVVATHLQLEQRVAVKFMRASEATSGSEAVARFLREARAAARIQSDHVARVSDFGTLESGAPYLVMEYLEGQDLEALLGVRGALPVELAADYALQACEGLAEAHAAGIVHRDLKPANLFLARRTNGSIRVKLLDFGISKLAASGAPDAAMTSTQALMGSPLYMAPEQMRSSKNVDARADIWSMGVILYEMLGGRPPFDGETLPAVCARIMTEPPADLRAVRPDLPPTLAAVVMKCLEKQSAQRFQDVASLARALGPFGPPDARATADRLARLSPGGAAAAAEPSSEPRVAVRTNRGAQTSATFTSTGASVAGRRRALVPIAMGASALLLGGAIVGGLAAMRGPSAKSTTSAVAGTTAAPSPRGEHDGSRAASAGPGAIDPGAPALPPAGPPAAPPPPESAAGEPTAPASAAVAPAPKNGVAPAVTAHPAAPPSAPPSSAAPALAAPAAAARPQPKPRPAAPAAAPAPRPAATAAFGGRD